MDFKKIATGAATFFNRAVQYTEERLGQADKTELDPSAEELLAKIDRIQAGTERIVKNAECVLQPNPAFRMEGLVLETLDRRKPDRPNCREALGQAMVDAGHVFGSDKVYGGSLVKVGNTEERLGKEEKEFDAATAKYFLGPLQSFLDHDIKSLQRERKVMETKRLDLDMRRSQLRRARTEKAKEQADEEVAAAQRDFDRQLGVVRHLAEGILSSQEDLRKCVIDFAEHQTLYFAKCHQHLMELNRQLTSDSDWSEAVTAASNAATAPSGDANAAAALGTESGTRRARVLYEYQAGDDSELNLQADEIITVRCASLADAELEMWLVAEKDGVTGKVPSAYVEVLED